MIPTVKAWRATADDGSRWVVWAPTAYLARLNLRAAGMWCRVVKLGRLPSADGRSIPLNMVEKELKS